MIDHVAIVGGGFSGSLAAINLLRHDGPRATLIDRQAAGTGLAYGAAHPTHLLNVRAANMSALPDDPAHFVRWLAGRGLAGASDFVPRLTYGDYLRELLDQTVRQSPGRLTIVQGVVTDLVHNEGVRVVLEDGRSVQADAAVLAVGNLPPHAPQGIDPDGLAPGRYAGNCWAPDATDGLGPDDTILIVGTGLTMIDMVLLLESKGFAGRIVAMSRRGLLPHAHAAPGAPAEPIRERPPSIRSALVGTMRERGEAIGWRGAIDELRPFTQDMWRAAPADDRARFLRHLRPWWDVHRHRLAPSVAERIAGLIGSGRLTIVAGKASAAVEAAGGAEIRWRPRGAVDEQTLVAQRIINCTGPQGDLLRVDDPVLRALVDRGTIRPDSERIGIDVDDQMRTVDASGRGNDWLFALGPMTRGAFWEVVAVPDIRSQAWTLARRLSNAHWVSEGL